MKKTILLGALLAAAAACTPLPSNNSNQPANSNTGANRNGAATPAPTVSESEIKDREKQVWDALKSKNWDAFAAFVHDQQLNVTSTGVYNKAETLEQIRNLELTDIAISDQRVIPLGADAAVHVYKTTATGTAGGRPIPAGSFYESTAWVKSGDKWLAIYHQDTKAMPMPEGPQPTPTPGAAAAPSTAPTPGADATAEARERYIWDALSRRDWDGFASFIADNAVEVEPNGIVDKAGSVSGVKQVDFTGVTLSDFREVRLNPNAVLVTYMVKGPSGPFAGAGSRHTTIWVNNGGRWLATFHQGTPIEQ